MVSKRVHWCIYCVLQEELRLETGAERTVFLQVAESVYRFGLGAFAGGMGTGVSTSCVPWIMIT